MPGRDKQSHLIPPFEVRYGELSIPIVVLQKGRIVFVNNSFLRLFGYEQEKELLRSGLKKVLNAESNKRLLKEESEHFDDTSLSLRLQGIKKDGEKFEIEVEISLASKDEIREQVVAVRDITREVSAMKTLEDRLHHYEAMFHQSLLPQVLINNGIIVSANPAFFKFFSIDVNTNLAEKQIIDLLEPEKVSEFQSLSKKILSGKVSSGELIHKAYRGDGVFFDSKTSISLFHRGNEKLLLLNFTDITSEIIEKEELQAKANEWARIDDLVSSLGEISELHQLLKVLPEKVIDVTHFHHCVMYIADQKGTHLEIHTHKGFPADVIEKISLLPFEEGIGGFVRKTLEPHCFEINKYPSYLPYSSIMKNAGFIRIGVIPFVSIGKVFGMILIATKNPEVPSLSSHLMSLLTKHGGEALSRVLSIEKLKLSEQEYRISVENTQSILYRLSSAGVFESFNAAIERLTGYTIREFLRTQSLWLSLIHPDDKKLILERQTNLSDITESYSIEYRIRPKGKAAYRWVRDAIQPVKTEDGSITYYEGTLDEITGYKQTIEDLSKSVEHQNKEQELSVSAQLLRNVIDTMEDVLVVSDLEGNVLQTNSAFEKMFGYSFPEAAAMEFPQPWLNIEETGRYVLWMANLQNSDTLYDFDMLWKTKQGKLLDMSICTSILRSSSGEPSAVITVARDITERKRLTKELEERNNQVELVNRIMMAAEHSNDFDEIFLKIAAELRKSFVFDDVHIELIADPGEMIEVFAVDGVMAQTKGMHIPIELTISQFTVRGQEPVIIADLGEYPEYSHLHSYGFNIRSQMSFPIVFKGRILGTLNLGSLQPNNYRNIQAKGIQLIAHQLGVIIDRVKLFQKVREDADYIRNLLDSIDNVVYTIGTDNCILEVNRAWSDFLSSYNIPLRKEYHGVNIFDVLPDDELKSILNKIIDDVFTGSIRYFSQEVVLRTAEGERVHQVTINPIINDKAINGVVISHTDITDVKRTASELKKYSDQLLTLNAIAAHIQTSKSFDEILSIALPKLQKTIDAEGIVIFLKDKDSEELVLSAHSVIEPSLMQNVPRLPIQSTITGKVLVSRQPLFIQRKAFSDTRILQGIRDLLKKGGIEAVGILPLVTHDSIFGALHVLFRTQQPFTEHVSQILTLVTNQLGTAIENVQLYDQLQTQIRQLSVLYQIGQQLTSTLEIEKIFEIVVEHVSKIVPFDRLSIELIDAEQFELTTSYEVSQVAGNVQIFPRPGALKKIDPQSTAWQVVNTKMATVQADGRLLVVPMLSKEKIIGVMSIFGQVAHRYTDAQIQMLESVANLMAIALEKGKLYLESITKTIEIERRNKELDDFAYVVSHDLKEPLISIEGFSRILESDYGESIVGEGKEYLDSIVAASGRMKVLIDDLLMLSRISRPTEAFKPVELQEVIDEIKADVEYTLLRKGALFIVENPLPVVIGNRSHLRILFQNLVSNALKFTEREQPLIEIGFQNTENNSYLFFVRDNGIGIEKDFQEKIFVIFQRLHRREDYEGTGAGLAIVKKIVEIHKGSIWVESEPGQGSTFYFTLPK